MPTRARLHARHPVHAETSAGDDTPTTHPPGTPPARRPTLTLYKTLRWGQRTCNPRRRPNPLNPPRRLIRLAAAALREISRDSHRIDLWLRTESLAAARSFFASCDMTMAGMLKAQGPRGKA